MSLGLLYPEVAELRRQRRRAGVSRWALWAAVAVALLFVSGAFR